MSNAPPIYYRERDKRSGTLYSRLETDEELKARLKRDYGEEVSSDWFTGVRLDLLAEYHNTQRRLIECLAD